MANGPATRVRIEELDDADRVIGRLGRRFRRKQLVAPLVFGICAWVMLAAWVMRSWSLLVVNAVGAVMWFGLKIVESSRDDAQVREIRTARMSERDAPWMSCGYGFGEVVGAGHAIVAATGSLGVMFVTTGGLLFYPAEPGLPERLIQWREVELVEVASGHYDADIAAAGPVVVVDRNLRIPNLAKQSGGFRVTLAGGQTGYFAGPVDDTFAIALRDLGAA